MHALAVKTNNSESRHQENREILNSDRPIRLDDLGLEIAEKRPANHCLEIEGGIGSKRARFADEADENSTMADGQAVRSLNFTAINYNANGVNKSAALLATKPGSTKKLVIKNFKGIIL